MQTSRRRRPRPDPRRASPPAIFSTGPWPQAWPAKPIRVVVPFPPGGGTDIIARETCQKVAAATGWTFVIDNKPGAGGNLGVDAVAKSPPDGYTLVLGQTSNLAINPTLYAKMPYDSQKDLAPIVLVANAPLVMVTGVTTSPYKTLADAVAAAKAKPGHAQLRLARQRHGRPPDERNVPEGGGHQVRSTCPYKGAAQALTDVISGTVELYMSSVPTLIGQIRNNKLRAAGGHLGQACGRPASGAHHQRVGLQGLRRGHLVRLAGAGRHAQGRGRAAQRRVQQGAAEPRLRKKLGDEGADPPAARPSSSPR
jgi:hypothetical protein